LGEINAKILLMDKDVLLSVSGLKVKFDHHLILDDISFEVEKNETLAIIGPNGAGKTVLFKALLGLIPFAGEVKWQSGLKIGYVPQKLALPRDLPLTTLEFLRLKENNLAKIYKILEQVGFQKNKPHEGHLKKHVLETKVSVLSGGEAQRILIAFALLEDPDVLLFDEPTAGVDISAEETIYSLLHKLRQKQSLTMLLISHEPEIVKKYADKVLDLGKQQK